MSGRFGFTLLTGVLFATLVLHGCPKSEEDVIAFLDAEHHALLATLRHNARVLAEPGNSLPRKHFDPPNGFHRASVMIDGAGFLLFHGDLEKGTAFYSVRELGVGERRVFRGEGSKDGKEVALLSYKERWHVSGTSSVADISIWLEPKAVGSR